MSLLPLMDIRISDLIILGTKFSLTINKCSEVSSDVVNKNSGYLIGCTKIPGYPDILLFYKCSKVSLIQI